MKERIIKVLKVMPGEEPVAATLENELTALQEAVSIECEERGLIEIIDLSEKVCLLCNEEGKLLNLRPNRRVGFDIIAGVFYVCGQNRRGDLCSLSDKEMDSYKSLYALGSDTDVTEDFLSLLSTIFAEVE